MQTFLPYPDFAESARVLDRQRLGKQRVEAMQIFRTLTGQSPGWANHPATRMWCDHTCALAEYGRAMISEWTQRGYRNTIVIFDDIPPGPPPPWLGNPAFHASHRSNLLRKAPDWYSQFGWRDDPTLPYIWPLSGDLT